MIIIYYQLLKLDTEIFILKLVSTGTLSVFLDCYNKNIRKISGQVFFCPEAQKQRSSAIPLYLAVVLIT